MKSAIAFGIKLGLTPAQAKALARLKTPEKVQDFVSAIPANFEPDGDTCLSVREAMRQRRAHCIEGAFVAACAFWMQGQLPLLMDLKARGDNDHVVALFRKQGCWGAISKSNHVWLRWRDPVYRNLRELALSYFHEYVTGRSKTLWSYSVPFDLRRCNTTQWVSAKESCWDVAEALDDIRHYKLITAAQAKHLRPRDKVEQRADALREYQRPRRSRRGKKR